MMYVKTQTVTVLSVFDQNNFSPYPGKRIATVKSTGKRISASEEACDCGDQLTAGDFVHMTANLTSSQ